MKRYQYGSSLLVARLKWLRLQQGQDDSKLELDGSLPANPVNDRRIANAVTLKSTFCLP